MTPTEARDYCDELIDQLRCERERQGVSREEIMRRGGPTAQCQYDIEKGNFGPRSTTLITLAAALDYDVCLVKRERP